VIPLCSEIFHSRLWAYLKFGWQQGFIWHSVGGRCRMRRRACPTDTSPSAHSTTFQRCSIGAAALASVLQDPCKIHHVIRMYLLLSLEKSSPPPNRQLDVYYDQWKYQADSFVSRLSKLIDKFVGSDWIKIIGPDEWWNICFTQNMKENWCWMVQLCWRCFRVRGTMPGHI
jgi:hypothetical protein